MYRQALTTFYVLSAFILMAVFFVVHPASAQDTQIFQNNLIDESTTAFNKLVSLESLVSDMGLIFDSVDGFYAQATQQTIIALTPYEASPEVQEYVDTVAIQVGTYLNQMFEALDAVPNLEEIAFVADINPRPLYNIIPDTMGEYQFDVLIQNEQLMSTGEVAGATLTDTGYQTTSLWRSIKDQVLKKEYYCDSLIIENYPELCVKD